MTSASSARLDRPAPRVPAPRLTGTGQHARLWVALATTATLCLIFAIIHLAFGIVAGERTIAALGGIAFAAAIVWYAAFGFARAGRVDAAVDTAVASILATSVAWVAIMPELHDIVTLAPVLAVGVALPYRSGRALVRILFVATVAAAGIALVGAAAPHPVTPAGYVGVVAVLGTVSITIMVLLALWHFSTHLRDAVDGMATTVDILRMRERAISATSSGIVIVDIRDEGRPVVFVNAAFERITGYGAEDVLGTDGRQLVGPDTDPVALAEHDRMVADGRDGTVTILNYRRDGTPFWNELSVSPIVDDAGAITHYVAVQVDVTERRALEERLLSAQRMEAVGQLAGGIAHDFNNILTAIGGYARVARDELRTIAPTEAVAGIGEDIDEISRAADRAAKLTRQLLAFGRRQVMRPEVVSVSTIVTEVGPMLRRLIGEQFRLETHLGADVPPVLADPGQLEQVIVNLALNARDASPHGGRITIETTVVAADPDEHGTPGTGPAVRLSVADDGTGIPPEVQARMFEPFFTTKERGQGTGLGLATVYGIVAQSGGRIRCRSTVGVGTTFDVDLPAHAGVLPSRQPEEPSSDATAEQPALTGAPASARGCILLVEDEPSVRSLTATLLRRAGYRVLEAGGADEALEAARAHAGAVDLLLTDVVMPGLSGPALAESMTAAYPMPVVFMSGYPDEVTTRAGATCPDGVLEKPFTVEALLGAVRSAIARTAAAV
jgi:PAS domain S-box-containing protein